MINPISSVHPAMVQQVAHARAEAKPDPHAQTPPVRKSGEVSQGPGHVEKCGTGGSREVMIDICWLWTDRVRPGRSRLVHLDLSSTSRSLSIKFR
jgi:hypothetical protein